MTPLKAKGVEGASVAGQGFPKLNKDWHDIPKETGQHLHHPHGLYSRPTKLLPQSQLLHSHHSQHQCLPPPQPTIPLPATTVPFNKHHDSVLISFMSTIFSKSHLVYTEICLPVIQQAYLWSGGTVRDTCWVLALSHSAHLMFSAYELTYMSCEHKCAQVHMHSLPRTPCWPSQDPQHLWPLGMMHQTRGERIPLSSEECTTALVHVPEMTKSKNRRLCPHLAQPMLGTMNL